MKKTVLASFLFAGLISVNTFAQAPATPTAPAAPAGKVMAMPKAQHAMADAATRTQKYTDRITKALGLDAATSKKVYDAYLARTNKVDAILAGTGSGKDKNDAFKANKAAYETTLKGILSADQFAKYQQMESDRKHHGGGAADAAPQK